MKNTDKKLISGILAGAMLLSFAGCGVTDKGDKKEKLQNDTKAKPAFDYDEVEDTAYDEDSYSEDYNKYAFNIMAVTASSGDADSNIMISPASIMFAMDMAAAGANGDTLDQINGMFTEDGDSVEQQAFASDMMNKINDSRDVKFSCANAIWNNSTLLGDAINLDYVDYVEDMFEAEIKTEEFGADTVDEINEWVEDNTDGMIDQVVDTIEPTTAMILVNAIAFEGKWEEAYEDYQVNEGEFTTSTGKTQDVTFLSSTESVYFETDKAIGFMKYYEGCDYAFVAILPVDQTISANEFIQDFTGDDYAEFIDSRSYEYDVWTMLPEFEYDYDVEMTGIMQDLGVEDAFIEGGADFSGITSSTGLYISRVLHKTHIELDRNGTKAAAATAVYMDAEMAMEPLPSVEVYCDRPFAYAIVDVDTMNPMFIGTVNCVE